MAESWDRRPIGIIAGNRYHFGIYDECIGVRYPIKGQYCISEVKLTPTVGNKNSSDKKDNQDRVYNSHAWKTILEVHLKSCIFYFNCLLHYKKLTTKFQ